MYVSDILLFLPLISSDVKSSAIIITYLTNFYILLFHKGHKINTKCEECVCPLPFYYLKLINTFGLNSVLAVFAQGWQENLSFFSVSPVHIIPALHEVQILLYICSQKMACHTKDCYMTWNRCLPRICNLYLKHFSVFMCIK